jgi:hypothetical protein
VAIVAINEFAIRLIIAHEQIQMAIAIHIGECGSVGAVGMVSQIVAGEVAFAVVEQNPIVKRPVPSFGQNEIRESVAIHVADPHIRRRFPLLIEQQNAIEPAQARLNRWRRVEQKKGRRLRGAQGPQQRHGYPFSCGIIEAIGLRFADARD